MEVGLDHHADLLIKISETATKEHGIEVSLEEMEKDWESIELDLQPYKETGIFMFYRYIHFLVFFLKYILLKYIFRYIYTKTTR